MLYQVVAERFFIVKFLDSGPTSTTERSLDVFNLYHSSSNPVRIPLISIGFCQMISNDVS